MRNRTTSGVLVIVAGLSMLLAACGGGAAETRGAGGAEAGKPQPGGTLTYLLTIFNTWERGLDPATAGTAPNNMLNAIFGQLFRQDKGKVIPDLATGYEVSDGGRTWTITLRKGVRFQDGTPFNAEAVAWNITRDLEAACSCNPGTAWPPLSSEGITTPDDHTVVLHFARPYAATINVLTGTSANRIASPTAVRKMGEEQFAQKPVGAGPFEVVRNLVSSELVLERNDDYWQQGRPFLDRLVFKSIGSEQAAYQALLAGQGQAVEGLTNPPLVQQASGNEQLTVTRQDSVNPLNIQLNTAVPPFDDKRAREAIYYATDTRAIANRLFYNMYPVTQSFTAPGGLFYTPEVPGYRTYDLARAKALVEELGGLKVDLITGNTYSLTQTVEVLQSQWARAGIETTIHTLELAPLIQEFQGNWQAAVQTGGGWDPEVGNGLRFRYYSKAPYSGVHDPKLDRMIIQAAEDLDSNSRARQYAQIAKYISDQAYSPFLVGAAPATAVVPGVHGPGLTSKIPSDVPLAYWPEVWIAQEAR